MGTMVRAVVAALVLGCCAAGSSFQGSSQRSRRFQDDVYLQTEEAKGILGGIVSAVSGLTKSSTTESKFPLVPDSMLKKMGIHDGFDGPVYGYPASEVRGGGMPDFCEGLCYDAPWGKRSENPACLCG